MTNLTDVSYKDLDVGQKLFMVEECGIDNSLIVVSWHLTQFLVNALGISYIEVDRRSSTRVYHHRDFYRIFLTKEDAIQYCEENCRAYSFLIDE